MSGIGRVLAAVVMVLFVGMTQQAAAAPIFEAEWRELAGGIFEYTYTVTNPGDSGQAIYDVSLPTFAGEVLSVSAPTGWEIYTGFNASAGLSFIDWLSPLFVDPDTGDLLTPFDILPGQTLTGFVFTSLFGPGEIPYGLVGTGFGGDPSVTEALTIGPAAATPVPEPATLTLLGTGVAAAWVARRRRKAA